MLDDKRRKAVASIRDCCHATILRPGPTRSSVTVTLPNNVELGRKGRWRSNVWTYPGASSLGSDARRGLVDHPTVKPTAMLEDALLDLTNRGDIVLDPFLGSGSTLIAADKAGRICRGVELDPLYIDVTIRRFEVVTGKVATREVSGESFAALTERRCRETKPRP
jgi:DNA modification methylase